MTPTDAPFRDQVVIITGASTGIGRELALQLATQGARLALAARDRERLEAVVRACVERGARAITVPTDVGDEAQCRVLIERTVAEFGRLDMLINNAGVLARDDLSDPAAIQQHLAVNLFGTYAVTQAFLPALSRSGGAIVNILSRNALAPIPVMPAYSMSKAAAFSLTQSLRVLLAAHGVRVDAVLPGPVDTDMLHGVDIPKASPESVARAVFDAIDAGEEDIFPDSTSALIADTWRNGATKTLERQLAQAVQTAP